MSDSNSQSEPTMEEILASIRRIISEDGAEGQEEEAAAPEEGEEPGAPAAEEPEPEPAAEAEPEPEAGGDVLDLTQMVEEDGSVVDLAKERENAQAAAAETEEASDEGAAEAEEEAEPADAEVPEPAEEAEAPEQDDESLLSDPTRSSAMASFAELAQAAGVHDTGGRIPLGSGLTLEQLVRDALEPYLKSWLDDNLAALVERIVREEVQKLVKRAEYR